MNGYAFFTAVAFWFAVTFWKLGTIREKLDELLKRTDPADSERDQ